MSKTSTTQRSKKLLEREGYRVANVERWNPFAGKFGVKQDLFGFGDLLAIRPGAIVMVQTTSAGEMGRRREKIAFEPRSLEWLEAGGKIEIHGWKKGGPRSNHPGRWFAKVQHYPSTSVIEKIL